MYVRHSKSSSKGRVSNGPDHCHQAGLVEVHEADGVISPGPDKVFFAHQAYHDLGRDLAIEQHFHIRHAGAQGQGIVMGHHVGKGVLGPQHKQHLLHLQPPWLYTPPAWPPRCTPGTWARGHSSWGGTQVWSVTAPASNPCCWAPAGRRYARWWSSSPAEPGPHSSARLTCPTRPWPNLRGTPSFPCNTPTLATGWSGRPCKFRCIHWWLPACRSSWSLPAWTGSGTAGSQAPPWPCSLPSPGRQPVSSRWSSH